eukprot:g3487.t1
MREGASTGPGVIRAPDLARALLRFLRSPCAGRGVACSFFAGRGLAASSLALAWLGLLVRGRDESLPETLHEQACCSAASRGLRRRSPSRAAQSKRARLRTLEHRWKLELQHKESEFSEKLDGQEKEHAASLNDSEARAAAVKKGLEDKCKTLEAEHNEKSKKLYEMALMHFLASAQQKNKGVEEKIVFAVWKSVARDQVAARREAALIREKKEGIDALRKQAEREQNQLRLAVEEDKKNREYLDKLKEEERKKSLVEKLTETQRAERAKCQREHEQASGEQRKIQNALRERNGELEAVIRDLEQKMEALERNVLQRKLQQSMKLQVLAPRVSVTINGDTVNMLDVEVAPSSEDLKGIMHREVLPRFSKILLSEDFDESRTQARVQEVMNEMVSVIENKLQGIFGANCLRTTASM